MRTVGVGLGKEGLEKYRTRDTGGANGILKKSITLHQGCLQYSQRLKSFQNGILQRRKETRMGAGARRFKTPAEKRDETNARSTEKARSALLKKKE